jgi:SAM-dependent methyltransferase
MIDVTCYNCNSSKRTSYASENSFNLVKCEDCGLLYVTPRPDGDEITKAHQLGMHEGEILLKTTGTYSATRSRAYNKILQDLYNQDLTQKQSTWLDIGCGQGEFMMALKRCSDGKVNPKGLEPNQYKRESARNLGLDIEFFDIGDCTEKFDKVSLLNVYSHLPDPVGFIVSIGKLLNQGGELLIQTGDVAHFSAREMYRPMLLPDHLSFTSEEILTHMLDHCGFRTIKVVKYPVVSFTPTNVIKEFAKLLHPGKTSRLTCMLNPKYRTDMYIRATLNN